jgi:hypothetical protein
MGDSDRSGQVCPPVVEYTTADQARAAAEVFILPEAAMVVRMLSDYAVLRDKAHVCKGGRDKNGALGKKRATGRLDDRHKGRNADFRCACKLNWAT